MPCSIIDLQCPYLANVHLKSCGSLCGQVFCYGATETRGVQIICKALLKNKIKIGSGQHQQIDIGRAR